MSPAPHDFSVDLGIYRLCSRCARPDLTAVRRQPCRPLPPEEAARAIARKLEMARQFRGWPHTERPITSKHARRGRRAT